MYVVRQSYINKEFPVNGLDQLTVSEIARYGAVEDLAIGGKVVISNANFEVTITRSRSIINLKLVHLYNHESQILRFRKVGSLVSIRPMTKFPRSKIVPISDNIHGLGVGAKISIDHILVNYVVWQDYS